MNAQLARNYAQWTCAQLTHNEKLCAMNLHANYAQWTEQIKLCGKKQGATQLAHNVTKVQIKLYTKKERKVKYELMSADCFTQIDSAGYGKMSLYTMSLYQRSLWPKYNVLMEIIVQTDSLYVNLICTLSLKLYGSRKIRVLLTRNFNRPGSDVDTDEFSTQIISRS